VHTHLKACPHSLATIVADFGDNFAENGDCRRLSPFSATVWAEHYAPCMPHHSTSVLLWFSCSRLAGSRRDADYGDGWRMNWT